MKPTFRRFRHLRRCLWLNPRFIFAVAGVIGVCCPRANLSARPAAVALLDRIAAIESSGKADAIGDGGKARGAHQMHLAAVLDCGGTKADWLNLTNRATSDKFAAVYLARIKAQLIKAGVAKPTDAQVYQVWNCGFTAAKRTGFDISKAPKITQQAIKKL